MRRFLFLQGVCSPFFGRLSDALVQAGHFVLKVDFNAGDLLYSWGRNSISFRGRPQELRDFYDRIYRTHGITDQVLFGDRRPIHRPAVEHGDVCGVRTHVFEEGYFRPHWVTLEREGVNGHSLLPRDPDWFWRASDYLGSPSAVTAFKQPFLPRSLHDQMYHYAGAWNPVLFPHYRSHAPMNAAVEYAGYAWRLPMLRLFKRLERARISDVLEGGRPFFVFPLQLSSDAQIRDHSRFANMFEVIEYVLASFTRFAPQDARLLIKNHPLDPGLSFYGRFVKRLALEAGLGERVVYVETGDLERMAAKAAGMVTVNSTAGMLALQCGCPVVCLSDPIYNLPGLTDQQGLDEFWCAPRRPDAEMFRRFRDVVIFTTQVNGGFYSSEAINFAVVNASRVLLAEQSPLECLLVKVPV